MSSRKLLIIAYCFISFPLAAASRIPVSSDKGLVASTNAIASEVGASILRKGGTAADAAVAVGFALAVTWPSAGNLAGGGFALVGTGDGKTDFIDYRETAPSVAQENFYRNEKGELNEEASKVGYRAVAVPGTIKGMETLHKKYGRLPWKTLLEPARQLAERGFPVDDFLLRSLRRGEKILERFPESRRIFLNNGKFWKRGDRFVQKDLARSIRLLQEKGPDVFYKGELGQRFVQAIQKEGGVISREDLKAYQVESRTPITRDWKNYKVVTAPPPSSGGTVLLEILGMLEKDDLKSLGFGSARYLHLLIEATKRGFADRSQWFGDPAFASNPIEKLLDPAYLAARRKSIDPEKASNDIEPAKLREEKPETTHFTIRDKSGMVVSNTYTLNGGYGSGAVAAGTGMLLNNEMDDFSIGQGTANLFGLLQGQKNKIEGRKRPLSSMTPTLVYEKGHLVLALGSPGGPTIINSVTQVLLNRLEFGMTIQEAVDAPRFHHQWQPNRIRYEPLGLNPDSRQILEKIGHVFDPSPFNIGDVQALAWDEESGWTGAADLRWGGVVVAE